MNYQQAIEDLEVIVQEIENENIGMDDLLEKVKKASELIRFCRSTLHHTEEEVQKILKDLKESSSSGK